MYFSIQTPYVTIHTQPIKILGDKMNHRKETEKWS